MASASPQNGVLSDSFVRRLGEAADEDESSDGWAEGSESGSGYYSDGEAKSRAANPTELAEAAMSPEMIALLRSGVFGSVVCAMGVGELPASLFTVVYLRWMTLPMSWRVRV